METAIALVTLLNKKMMIGFKVFITSFLINNPWFKQDLVILNIDLDDGDKNVIKKFYPKVIFKDVAVENYKKTNMEKTADRLKPTYYKLEIFNLIEYERIVFIDVDTVVLDDVSDLFYSKLNGIAGAKGYIEKSDSLRQDINSGVLVVTSRYLTYDTYQNIIAFAEQGFSMPDQKAINQFFKDIKFFNKAFNVEKRMEHSKNFKHILENKKIVHYVAGKPWENNEPEKGKYPAMENIWDEWYRKVMKFETSLENDEKKTIRIRKK